MVERSNVRYLWVVLLAFFVGGVVEESSSTIALFSGVVEDKSSTIALLGGVVEESSSTTVLLVE